MPLYAVTAATQLFRLVADSVLADGTSQARKLVIEGGVRLDGEQIKDPMANIELEPGSQKVLQVGRRKFVKLTRA